MEAGEEEEEEEGGGGGGGGEGGGGSAARLTSLTGLTGLRWFARRDAVGRGGTQWDVAGRGGTWRDAAISVLKFRLEMHVDFCGPCATGG